MRNSYQSPPSTFGMRLTNIVAGVPNKTAVGLILIIALLAFEIFNFDTTQYALNNLIGDVRFLGLQWASILAIAFCSIDFAGLIRLFTPERGNDEPKEVWYLMGAWLLGATMNAIMTWWAISLTLLNHNFGNEVLSRDQLLLYVPIFVAVLVWLTRILFIGAFTVAGEHIFDFGDTPEQATSKQNRRQTPSAGRRRTPRKVGPSPMRAAPKTVAGSQTAAPKPRTVTTKRGQTYYADDGHQQEPFSEPVSPQRSRIRQRPPRPNGIRRSPMSGIHARPRGRQ